MAEGNGGWVIQTGESLLSCDRPCMVSTLNAVKTCIKEPLLLRIYTREFQITFPWIFQITALRKFENEICYCERVLEIHLHVTDDYQTY